MVKRKKKYHFYYDEAFHDRKLTENKKIKGELNIENDEQADNFISVAIGFKEHQVDHYLKNYLAFEERTKSLLGIQFEKEFKGTTIKKKNFKYGIHSFNKDAITIYTDFFDIIDMNFIIQISIMNKFELLINSILKDVQLYEMANRENFMYSIIKFMNQYKNKRLISLLFDDTATSRQAIDVIFSLLDEVLNHIKDVPRKTEEVRAIKEIKTILKNSRLTIQTNQKYHWDYSRSIEGISLLLDELNIKQKSVLLFIDNEKETVAAAQKLNFNKVKGVESEDFVGVRIADILSNFIGRIIKAIEDEHLEDWDKEETKVSISQLRILSKEWFVLTESQFNLYKKVANVFIDRKDIYWTIQTGNYAGNASVFLSLIYYIGLSFETYNDYKKIDLEFHREKFNQESVNRESSIFY
ncbi:hypothetical protein ACFP65_01570 [Marinilactibacillus sp. GCM10026970]|uniref:hypothetical protein n=1 Tax=Marinilactibacillus sp. GCM10026970 TaxID=3252642 RepID=UPI00361355FC